jgi:hypothetical protein
MKSAVLVVSDAAGRHHAVTCGPSLAPVLAAARTVKHAGTVQIGGEIMGVTDGIVQASWRPFPVMRFHCGSTVPPITESPRRKGK